MTSKYQHQGIAFIRVNGQEIKTKTGATLQSGGATRTVVKGQRVYGFSVTPTEAIITCTIPKDADLSIEDINNMDDVTVTFDADVGKSYLLANAWSGGNAQLTDTGDVSTTFTAVEAKEVS